MKRIVIHAGPGKTGSSALQASLLANSDKLAEVEVLYPKHGLDKNSISTGHASELLTLSQSQSWELDADKI
ncbi:MAG: hypothetical protein KDI01_05005, partial [Halioglobus sp.]|nr:hypothetical protein [Halioglobus sp.]